MGRGYCLANGSGNKRALITEARPTVKIRKDREKIEVGLGAHSPSVVVRRVRYCLGAKR